MKPLLLCLSYLLITHITFAQENSLSNTSRTRIIDNHWYFKKDTLSDYKKLGFDDSSWRFLNLPHDWSIEDLPNQLHDSISGPFSKASIGKGATAYTVGGTGWYRKKFSLKKSEQNKTVYLNFDGVYMNATVWLNGHILGNHPYGYTPFNYNITAYLKPAGQQNELAVRVNNTGKNSRWYSGSGIYRHVSLTCVNPVHIIPAGVQLLIDDVSDKSAEVSLISTIKNQQANTSYQLRAEIYDRNGKIIGSSNLKNNILKDAELSNLLKIRILNPKLWSTENPYLYKATIQLSIKNKIYDRLSVRFGVRSISINSKTGLVLNGKPLKLKGGCIHHDNGPLGAAAIDRAEERKVELLKANGFNAVRTSHNPPSEVFLNACDRLGMLVLDEAFDMWNVPKNPDDYHLYFKNWWEKDLTSIIKRDRNHPSVILWSIGNEIPERVDAAGLLTTKMLADKVHQLDPSRMVTEAVCSFWDKGGDKNYTWDGSTPPVFKLLDVGGYNYEMDRYEPDHAKYPQRTMLGTESFPLKAYENWLQVEKNPFVIGDFVWTAMDYLGEAAIGHSKLVDKNESATGIGGADVWPWFNAYCGDLDLIGDKKPQSYYRDVVWRNSKIEILVHCPIPKGKKEIVSSWGWPDEQPSWSWPDAKGDSLQVRVVSRSPKVRLELNGKVVGEQIIAEGTISAYFKVAYQPGKLKAVGIENGKEAASKTLTTTGKPAALKLTADRQTIQAGLNDLAYIKAEVVDANGNTVPYANEVKVSFKLLSDKGSIVAVGNGNPKDISSFCQPEKKAWRGVCQAIIRSDIAPGKIILQAEADGLKQATITVNSK